MEDLRTEHYNLNNIRTLLTEGFTVDELRRLCYDRPDFRPIFEELASESGKAKVIDRLIEHADRKLQIDNLLAWAKEHNPARYEKHRPYWATTLSSPGLNYRSEKKSPEVEKGQIIESPLRQERSYVAKKQQTSYDGNRASSKTLIIGGIFLLIIVIVIGLGLLWTKTPTKCEAIKAAFPQSLEDVRAKFKLPANERTFRLVYEECGAVATGFIFEGNTEFELPVPQGGCIDSYNGAYFSEKPVANSFNGLRVYSGIVRATGMTYRTAWCETKQ